MAEERKTEEEKRAEKAREGANRPIQEGIARCPECTGAFRSSFGLAIHRSKAHGVAGKFAAQKARLKGKKAPQSKPVEGLSSVGAAFDGMAQMMNAHAEIVTQCLDGLDRLLGQAKELRKAYIKSADRLRKIGADVSGFTNNGHNE